MILIALGGNVSCEGSSVEDQFCAAIEALEQLGVHVVRASSLYQSVALGPPQPDYLNAVIHVRSVLSPYALMRRLHAVEAGLGRERRIKWGPRTIDLDLIDYHGSDVDTRIKLPHPRMQSRAFVLMPLFEIAPDWRHPKTGQSVSSLIQFLSPRQKNQIKRLKTRFSLHKYDDTPK